MAQPTGDLARKVLSGSGLITCLYPKDPSLALGSLAAILLFTSAVVAVVSLIYPYEGKSISIKLLAQNLGLVAFVVISVYVSHVVGFNATPCQYDAFSIGLPLLHWIL